MKNIVLIELKRAFKNKTFFISVLLGIVIGTIEFVIEVLPLASKLDEYLSYNKPMNDISWLFSNWLGGHLTSIYSYVFFLLIPVIAILPFATSGFEDFKSGFAKNIVVRVDKRKYYFAKYFAVFITGGTAVILPVIYNLALSAVVLPSVLPQKNSSTFALYGIHVGTELFFNHPYVYIFMYLFLDFIFAGLIATVSLLVGLIAEHKFEVLFAPFIGYIFINSVCNLLGLTENSPVCFLRPGYGITDLKVVVLIGVTMFVITFCTYVLRGQKKDVI
ncbi:MAG: hypothetical protein IJ439_01695 [Tyzzerella sp.]|nr:hypothetical protein [Tyzzerella sp.]